LSLATLAGGRFRVKRKLGEGGMATVYLARDEELDRPVAVKVLAAHLAGDEDVRERFLREARLAARLSHPNVVAVFDAGEDDGAPYIVMECVEGETLAETLERRGKLPPAEAVTLAVQACSALEHAHAAGLVHRDVKPGNLLLRKDGTLKISDFGIARAAETTGITQAGTILGTAAYLAPEQAAGEEVTAAADLYSLGAVVYEALTGQPPYTVDSLAQLVHKREGRPITPVRDLSPEVPRPLEDVVMRTLARLPQYRPTSAAELARQLAAAVPEAATERLPRDEPTRVVRPPRRRPWPLAAAAAAALIVGLLGFAVAGGDEEEPATRVEPVPRGATAEEHARNFADWLRDNASD
jgi:serine/threonine protein kinase